MRSGFLVMIPLRVADTVWDTALREKTMRQRGVIRGQRVSPRKLERAKELRREMTPTERVLWHELRTNRFQGLHFRRQQVIDGFIADFYCHRARLVVEVDGAVHAQRAEYDQARDRHLATLGLEVLRFPASRIESSPKAALRDIAEICWRRIRLGEWRGAAG